MKQEGVQTALFDGHHVDDPSLHRFTFHQLTIKTLGTIPEDSIITVSVMPKDSGEYEVAEGGELFASVSPTTIKLPEWLLDFIKVEGDAAFVTAGCTLTVIYSGFATATP